MRVLIMLNADADPQAGVAQEHDGLIEVYYLFSDAGIEIVLAAPGGGSAIESSGTASGRDDTSAMRAIQRYNADRRARDVMNDLVDLADVYAEDFDAALCLSRQAFNDSPRIKDYAGVVVNRLLTAAKPVAVIGQPPASASIEGRNGLLMIGHSSEALRLAARALLGAVRGR
jgi:hypothetical protein